MFVRLAVVASSLLLTLSLFSVCAHAQSNPGPAEPTRSSGADAEGAATPESGVAPLPEPTSQENVDRAIALHDEARGLYSEGKYGEAIDKLTEAVRLDPAAGLLFYNLGLIEEKVGRLDAARGHYQRALELSEDSEERLKLAKIIKRLEGAQQATVEPKPKPAPAEGAPAAERPSTEAASGGVSPWVYVTGATAVVGLVIGAVMASRAAALDPGDELTTDADTSVADLQADAEAAHDFAIGADVGFIVGGAAAVACLVIAIAVDGDPPAQSAAVVQAGPTGAKMVWRF